MAIPVVPVGKRIVVRPLQKEDTTKSGIIIASTQKEKPERGEVVAIGEVLDGVRVGDTVVFSKYGYDEVAVDGKDFYIIKHDDVVAVIK